MESKLYVIIDANQNMIAKPHITTIILIIPESSLIIIDLIDCRLINQINNHISSESTEL